MAEKNQSVEQLTPRSVPIDLHKYDDPFHKEEHPHRKYVKCCGCITALTLISAVIVLVLIFTLFWAKSPVLRLNSIRIEGLQEINWKNVTPNTNLTIYAQVSVKNRNLATFKYRETSTYLFYERNLVGEAWTPPGSVGAKKTEKVNATIDVMVKNMLDVPKLKDDFIAGFMLMNTYTRINGRVKIFNVVKKSVVLKTNCTMKVNFTSYVIQAHTCKRQITI